MHCSLYELSSSKALGRRLLDLGHKKLYILEATYNYYGTGRVLTVRGHRFSVNIPRRGALRCWPDTPRRGSGTLELNRINLRGKIINIFITSWSNGRARAS